MDIFELLGMKEQKDKRLDVVTAYVTNIDDWGVRILSYYIQEAIYKKQKVLPIIIDSYGGEVYAALSMLDSLKASGLEIITISKGKTMSAGTLLLSIGSKRYATENSTLMIHEASAGGHGTASAMANGAKHVKDMSNKMFDLMAENCNKPKGFFQDLVKQNDNQDLFMTAQEALNSGLITDIGYPSIAEIFPETPDIPEIESENQNDRLKILMSYSLPQKKDINNQVQEVQVVDLQSLKASLKPDQIKPIEALENQLLEAQKKESSLINSVAEKEKQLSDIVAAHEKKLADIEANNDKTFLDSLKASSKLSQADYDSELSILASLSGNEKAKNAYKAKLSASSSVVPKQVGINEQDADLSNENLGKKIVAYAQANGLNLAKDYEKARQAVLNGGK